MFIAVRVPVVTRRSSGDDNSTPTNEFPPEDAPDAAGIALYAYWLSAEHTYRRPVLGLYDGGRHFELIL